MNDKLSTKKSKSENKSAEMFNATDKIEVVRESTPREPAEIPGDKTGSIPEAINDTSADFKVFNLEDCDEKFKNVVKSSPMGMHFYRLEPNGDLIFEGANPAADKLLGIDHRELVGLTIEKAFPASVGTEISERYKAAASDGIVWEVEQINYNDNNIQGAFQVTAFQTSKDRVAAMFFDITERKKMEKRLKESEALFRDTFERAAVGIAQVAPDGRLMKTNQKFCDITGYTREELLQCSFQDISHPDDVDRDAGFLRRMLDGEIKTYSIEKRFRRKDGSVTWANLTTTLLRDSKNIPRYFISVIENITERRKAETGLKKSEEKYRTLFEAANDSIMIIELLEQGSVVIDCNARTLEMFGCEREDIIGKTPMSFVPRTQSDGRQSTEHINEISRQVQNRDIYHVDWIFQKSDKTKFHAELSITHIEISGKGYLQVVIRDISWRKKTEEALKESEEKFRNLAEWSPNMIFINKGGRVVYVNRKCEEIIGYSREEFYAPEFDFMTVIAPEYMALIKNSFSKHLKGEEIDSYEYALITRDNRAINCIINTRLIKYEGENAVLGIITDITEHKKAMNALQLSERNLARAQKIARIGSWFWDIVSRRMHWSDQMYDIYGIDRKINPTVELIEKLIYPEDLLHYDRVIKDLLEGTSPRSIEYRIIKPGGVISHVQALAETQHDENGNLLAIIGTVQDITERKKADELRERLIADYQKAANEIKTLSGLIPICASCKKIRDDKGYWEQIETYIMERSDAEFSHGLCPECSKKLYPDL